MIELYNAALSTCSQKVRLCLAEKRLAYVDRQVNLAAQEQDTPAYRALNPNGVVPTLVHDGQPIIDSSVIIEYLEECFPQYPLAPASPVQRAAMRAWLRFVEEVPTRPIRVLSINRVFITRYRLLSDQAFQAKISASPLRKHFYTTMGRNGFGEKEEREALEAIQMTFDRVERALARAPWLAGNTYSLADICLFPFVQRIEDLRLGELFEARPMLTAWKSRMQSRDSFREAFYAGSRLEFNVNELSAATSKNNVP